MVMEEKVVRGLNPMLLPLHASVPTGYVLHPTGDSQVPEVSTSEGNIYSFAGATGSTQIWKGDGILVELLPPIPALPCPQCASFHPVPAPFILQKQKGVLAHPTSQPRPLTPMLTCSGAPTKATVTWL